MILPRLALLFLYRGVVGAPLVKIPLRSWAILSRFGGKFGMPDVLNWTSQSHGINISNNVVACLEGMIAYE